MKKIISILTLGFIFGSPNMSSAQMSINLISPPTMVSTANDSTGINSFVTSWACVWPTSYKSVSISFQVYDSLNAGGTLVQCGTFIPNSWDNGDTIINYQDNLPNCLTVAYRVRMEVQFWSSGPITIFSPYLYVPLWYGNCGPQGITELFSSGEQYKLITYNTLGQKLEEKVISDRLPSSENGVQLYQLFSLKDNSVVGQGKLPIVQKF